MSMHFQLAGLIGLSLSLVTGAVSSWRLLFHSWGCFSKGCQRKNSFCRSQNAQVNDDEPAVEGITLRRFFHFLLWLDVLFQAAAYTGLVFDTQVSDKLGYTLGEIIGRNMIEFACFSVVTAGWVKATSPAITQPITSSTSVSPLPFQWDVFSLVCLLLSLAWCILVINNIFEARDLWANYETVFSYQDVAQKSLHSKGLVVDACGWSLHGLLIVIYGLESISKRIQALPSFRNLPSHKQGRVLCRALATMFTCAACYLLRALLNIICFVHISIHQGEGNTDTLESTWWYWVWSIWIPSYVPAILLLYSMRQRDRVPGYIPGLTGAASFVSIPYPTPPEEIFSSFTRALYGNSSRIHDDSFDFDPILGGGGGNFTLREKLLSQQHSPQHKLQQPDLEEIVFDYCPSEDESQKDLIFYG